MASATVAGSLRFLLGVCEEYDAQLESLFEVHAPEGDSSRGTRRDEVVDWLVPVGARFSKLPQFDWLVADGACISELTQANQPNPADAVRAFASLAAGANHPNPDIRILTVILLSRCFDDPQIPMPIVPREKIVRVELKEATEATEWLASLLDQMASLSDSETSEASHDREFDLCNICTQIASCIDHTMPEIRALSLGALYGFDIVDSVTLPPCCELLLLEQLKLLVAMVSGKSSLVAALCLWMAKEHPDTMHHILTSLIPAKTSEPVLLEVLMVITGLLSHDNPYMCMLVGGWWFCLSADAKSASVAACAKEIFSKRKFEIAALGSLAAVTLTNDFVNDQWQYRCCELLSEMRLQGIPYAQSLARNARGSSVLVQGSEHWSENHLSRLVWNAFQRFADALLLHTAVVPMAGPCECAVDLLSGMTIIVSVREGAVVEELTAALQATQPLPDGSFYVLIRDGQPVFMNELVAPLSGAGLTAVVMPLGDLLIEVISECCAAGLPRQHHQQGVLLMFELLRGGCVSAATCHEACLQPLSQMRWTERPDEQLIEFFEEFGKTCAAVPGSAFCVWGLSWLVEGLFRDHQRVVCVKGLGQISTPLLFPFLRRLAEALLHWGPPPRWPREGQKDMETLCCRVLCESGAKAAAHLELLLYAVPVDSGADHVVRHLVETGHLDLGAVADFVDFEARTARVRAMPLRPCFAVLPEEKLQAFRRAMSDTDLLMFGFVDWLGVPVHQFHADGARRYYEYGGHGIPAWGCAARVLGLLGAWAETTAPLIARMYSQSLSARLPRKAMKHLSLLVGAGSVRSPDLLIAQRYASEALLAMAGGLCVGCGGSGRQGLLEHTGLGLFSRRCRRCQGTALAIEQRHPHLAAVGRKRCLCV
eukprot:TRINITY_DN20923_c0_g1_i2.p1 TRINITY_DN20923_c0_g1~~TRINITY_DN20923_c0_g1_i2.p1  ORF type:complete len:893 (-),score=80.50 TRINITY_DN20923_c0_g1_i2:114-2756(-)